MHPRAPSCNVVQRRAPSCTLVLLLSVLLLAGCGGALSALAHIAEGAGWLGTVVEVAQAGADAYFARHPSQESEHLVTQAIVEAEQAAVALEAAARAAHDAGGGDVATARTRALEAYRALRELLASLGVLTASPPAGGAETDAPLPVPLDLPTVAEVASRL